MKRILIFLMLVPIFGISQPVTDGLVGYWPFNGNANDESGNGLHGTINGATLATDRFGKANSAYQFDGVNDFVNIPDNPLLQITSSLTISTWIKRVVLDNTHREIVRKGFQYFLLVNEQNELGLGINSGEYSNGFLLSGTGQWEHMVGVYNKDEGAIYLYLNGNLVHNFQTSRTLQSETYPLRIGSTQSSSQFFSGFIDDVLLFDRALSEQEVQALYIGQTPPPPPPSPELCQNVYCDGENIGIGTSNTSGHKLAVAGDIITEKIKVALQINWPDYVFDENYKLNDLNKLEQFIVTEKHLPNIPDAQTIKNDGYELGEMDSKLLEKIEELTLYMIEQNKKTESLVLRIENLEKENIELKEKLIE